MSRDSASGHRWRKIQDYHRTHGAHICGLCGQAIDMRAPIRSPQSWSVDHITPVAEAPHLKYELSNTREAHYGCNSSRADGVANKRRANNTRDW